MIITPGITTTYQYIAHSKFHMTVVTLTILSFFDYRKHSFTSTGIRKIDYCSPSQPIIPTGVYSQKTLLINPVQ